MENEILKELQKWDLSCQNADEIRKLLVAFDNFKLMTPEKFSCSEQCIDAFLKQTK